MSKHYMQTSDSFRIQVVSPFLPVCVSARQSVVWWRVGRLLCDEALRFRRERTKLSVRSEYVWVCVCVCEHVSLLSNKATKLALRNFLTFAKTLVMIVDSFCNTTHSLQSKEDISLYKWVVFSHRNNKFSIFEQRTTLLHTHTHESTPSLHALH